ncbi:MAG: M20/M25/M40 family metallo-hydrolase [Candidatus Poseidoniaceae archaeon]|mgnify:CR=1 FL=1|nr:M20/M25/M40 family metallo-hydrolase [Candidatus Poseidoniaceae archaeon]
MAGTRGLHALMLVLIMFMAPLAGCFGENDGAGKVTIEDAIITPQVMTAGVFQGVTIIAESDLSAFVPYLVKDDESGFVVNSTVVDLRAGEQVQLSMLAPPRADMGLILLGEYGRDNWPIRDANESWATWYGQDGHKSADGGAIVRLAGENATLNASQETGGPVAAYPLTIVRPTAPAYSTDEGGRHSTGLVAGRTTYNYLHHLTDQTVDPLDLSDGAVGYLNRWAGQGNTAFEEGAVYLMDRLESFGLEVVTQRYAFTDVFGNQNPEAYNICGFRYGNEVPDEWMVFGAHFDVAPPANLILDDPHVTGVRSYGTRVGAYDNTAGTSMVLTVAEAMSSFETRRTMVFCFWSGEEGGKRGSDYWTDYYVKEDNPQATVTNYINLDMAGVNWPGGGGAPHGDPATAIDADGYPKDEEVWPMRVYLGPSLDHDVINQPEMVGLTLWIGADAIGVEQQQSVLIGEGFGEDTWKVDDWLERGRPEIIVYEDITARSDHASFQDNLGTVTIGFGGLVDGYWCYHQTCDTLEEMEDWMDTTGKDYGEEHTGVSNLVDSLDIITWWAAFSFFHLDEKPVLNAYL